MDSINEDLLLALYNETYITGMRLERNVEEHELFRQYMEQCNKSRTKAEFLGLINYLHLTGLLKYKEVELKTLKKYLIIILTGESLQINVATENGLIFTELINQHP
ncbi:unnamed protein product [Rotaria sp. Silwood2]|nr:unnamed protein product [Rotaria sp. Silwood2]